MQTQNIVNDFDPKTPPKIDLINKNRKLVVNKKCSFEKKTKNKPITDKNKNIKKIKDLEKQEKQKNNEIIKHVKIGTTFETEPPQQGVFPKIMKHDNFFFLNGRLSGKSNSETSLPLNMPLCFYPKIVPVSNKLYQLKVEEKDRMLNVSFYFKKSGIIENSTHVATLLE